MTPHKLIAEVESRGRALEISGALQDLIEPAPDALTVFEIPRPAGAGDAPRPLSWRIEAYFSDERDGAALAQEIALLIGGPPPEFRPDEIPDVNWVALSQAALPPVAAGRFTVHGSHDRDRVPQGPNAILIEAGEAFGTAHHATTYGCLLALARLGRERTFERILDLGCGSGVLAIAAARSWPKARVYGVDIDKQSVLVAAENARVNRVEARIDFAWGGISAPLVRHAGPFDLIVANILAAPLIALARDVRRAIAPGGTLVLSGLLAHEAAPVVAAYRAQGFALVVHGRHDGWAALTLVRRA